MEEEYRDSWMMVNWLLSWLSWFSSHHCQQSSRHIKRQRERERETEREADSQGRSILTPHFRPSNHPFADLPKWCHAGCWLSKTTKSVSNWIERMMTYDRSVCAIQNGQTHRHTKEVSRGRGRRNQHHTHTPLQQQTTTATKHPRQPNQPSKTGVRFTGLLD